MLELQANWLLGVGVWGYMLACVLLFRWQDVEVWVFLQKHKGLGMWGGGAPSAPLATR